MIVCSDNSNEYRLILSFNLHLNFLIFKLYKKLKLLSNGLILRNYKNTLFHWKNQLQKIQYIIEDTKVIFLERNLNEFVLPNSNNRLTIMNAIRRILHILNPFNIMKLHFDKCAIDLLNFFPAQSCN